MGDWKNYRLWHLDRRRGSKPRRKYSVTRRTREKYDNGCRYLFERCDPAKTQAQDIQRTEQAVRPRWEWREGPALERGCNSTFLFLGRAGKLLVAFCLCFVLCALCSVCVCFPFFFLSTGDHFSAKLKETWALDADQVADVRNRRASIFSPITLLKLARTSNAQFGRSANALG